MLASHLLLQELVAIMLTTKALSLEWVVHIESAQSTVILLDSLTSFYQQERYWIHPTRAALEVAIAKGSDARALTYTVQSPPESSGASTSGLSPDSVSSPAASRPARCASPWAARPATCIPAAASR